MLNTVSYCILDFCIVNKNFKQSVRPGSSRSSPRTELRLCTRKEQNCTIQGGDIPLFIKGVLIKYRKLLQT